MHDTRRSTAPRSAILLSRRDALSLALGTGLALPLMGGMARAQQDDAVEGTEFSFDKLSDDMRRKAQSDYVAPEPVKAQPWAEDYDEYRRIQFRDKNARWIGEEGGPFQLRAFPMGWLFDEPVTVYEVMNGRAREMVFSTADFLYDGELAEQASEDKTLPGIAGFKINTPLNRPDRYDELISFLGASYFRALGRGNVYGLSARGIAVDTATDRPEEFPVFTEFWLDRTAAPESVMIYAALDGPSLTGAYKMLLTPGDTTIMDVTARLYPRVDIGQLGVAPMTSMYLFSETNRSAFDDYRPAVHDSGGLHIRRQNGDDLWRPLNNPPRLASSYLSEASPRGFGLHQRDRAFRNYQDDGARYERRPSLEVEPVGDWGNGTVRLIEIPTELEANDNIVAYWVPQEPARAGEAREFSYRLRWGDLPVDADADLAYVAETRAGAGGVAGVASQANTRKFVVDFAGGKLSRLPNSVAFPSQPEREDGSIDEDAEELPPEIELVTHAEGAEITSATLHKIGSTGHWRAAIDVSASQGAVTELSAHVAGFGQKLSEVWIYQWINE